MAIQILIRLLLILSVVSVTSLAHAQPRGGANSMPTSGPRKYLSNIVLAGMAGAILGLSTLSFYGRPQDRLANIAVGFAVGVIGGTMFSTYKMAAEPKDFYGLRRDGPRPEAWALTDQRQAQPYTPSTGFVFNF